MNKSKVIAKAKPIVYAFGLFVALILGSCFQTRYSKAIEAMKNMPTADYSYMVEPIFRISKKASEIKLKAFYNAEELKVGASGFHTYEGEENMQINERFWLKSVIVNSTNVEDVNDINKSRVISLDLAEAITEEVTNLREYDKIEISLLRQWNDGQPKSIERRYWFKLPGFEETDWEG